MCFFLKATLLATTGCFCFRAQQADSAAWEVVAASLPLFASIILRGGKCTWTLKIPPKNLGNAGAWRKSAWHPHDPPDGEKGRDITSAQWGGNESWAKKKNPQPLVEKKKKSTPRWPQPQSKALPALKQCAQSSLLAAACPREHQVPRVSSNSLFPTEHQPQTAKVPCALCPFVSSS